MRWSVPPARAAAQAARRAAFAKNEPSAIERSISSSAWGSAYPAPMVRWPTSLLPITPGGRPTAVPLASSFACG